MSGQASRSASRALNGTVRGGHRMASDYVSEWMTDELQALRDVAREFFEREAAPQMAKWSEQRFVDREFWVKAGRVGLLRPPVPEEYAGPAGHILRHRT